MLAGPMPAGAFARASSEPGKFYAVYLHQSDWGGKSGQRRPSYEIRPGYYRTDLPLNLPAGTYEIAWFNPTDLQRRCTEDVNHPGGRCLLVTPVYTEDIALTVRHLN